MATLRHYYFQVMKKWLIVTGAVLALAVCSIFIFIPSNIAITKITTANITITGAIRFLSREDNWEKWWRDQVGKPYEPGKPFIYNGASYQLTHHENKAIGIEIEKGDLKLNSVMSLASLKVDSIIILWECTIPAGSNPFNRLKRYREAFEIRNNMIAVLQNFNRFMAMTQNIYGLKITGQSTNDTMLLSARYKNRNYPSTEDIYGYLHHVEENIKKQKATVTGFPMLHIKRLPDSSYETQVALPTSLWLKENGEFFPRRMPKGYFLVADVKGGPHTIERAVEQMDYYISDYNKIVMAIPIQYLITNRIDETDTSKWITRLCVPAME
jgi:hypothetical protein